MKSELIVLFAFASLAQSSDGPTSNVDYELCKKRADFLRKIMVNRELTRTTCADGLKTLFDIIFDLEAGTDVYCSKIAEASLKVNAAIDISLDTDILALGESCYAAVEVARKAAHTNLHDAFASIRSAFKLARSGNYSRNRDAIEDHHAAAQKNYTNLVEIDYDLIKICLNTREADTLAEIKGAREGSLVGATHIINAVFNAIKVTAAAVPVKCEDVILTHAIEDFKHKTLASLEINVDYKFNTLQTLYVNSHPN